MTGNTLSVRHAHPYPTTIAFIAIIFFSFIFLYSVGIDALELRNDFQFYADSSTYHIMYEQLTSSPSLNDFLGITKNYLGPFLILALCFDNYYAIAFVNVTIFFFVIKSLRFNAETNSYSLFFLLIINPLTISSLLSVNKEIISLLCVSVFVAFLNTGKTRYFAVALAISALARWQLTLFVLLAWLMTRTWEGSPSQRWAKLVILLISLSTGYVVFDQLFDSVNQNFLYSVTTQQDPGSGLYEWLVKLQLEGFYFLVFPIKAAHLLFGLGLRLDRVVNPTQIYNDTFHLLHSTSTLIIFIILLLKGRFSIRSVYIYVSLIYIILFTLSPIYSPRYFYPVYVLWAIVLATRQRRSFERKSAPYDRALPA